MRKLKLQMQVTVNGFVARPDGTQDFMQEGWDAELLDAAWDIARTIDLIIMGRKMAFDFAPYWQKVAEDPKNDMYEGGKLMVDTPKKVFSKTLDKTFPASEGWKNVEIESGDLVKAVNALKQQPGKDMMVYGGASFVTALLRNKLVDEVYLFVNPVAIEKGMSIFNAGDLHLKLVETRAFGCGVTLLKYLPAYVNK